MSINRNPLPLGMGRINNTSPIDHNICICGSRNIQTHKYHGFDIWEDGEEDQHLDVCLACGAERIWADVWSLTQEGSKHHVQYGRWWIREPQPHPLTSLEKSDRLET